MVGGWNGCGWLPVGGRETLPTSWSKKAVRLIGEPGDCWFHIGMVDSANSYTLKAFLDKAIKVGSFSLTRDGQSGGSVCRALRDRGAGDVTQVMARPCACINPVPGDAAGCRRLDGRPDAA